MTIMKDLMLVLSYRLRKWLGGASKLRFRSAGRGATAFVRMGNHETSALVAEWEGNADYYGRPSHSAGQRTSKNGAADIASNALILVLYNCLCELLMVTSFSYRVYKSALRHRLQSQRLSHVYNLLPL